MTEGSEEAGAKAQPETQRPEQSEGTLQKKKKKKEKHYGNFGN